jgi:hypothetical protein
MENLRATTALEDFVQGGFQSSVNVVSSLSDDNFFVFGEVLGLLSAL